MFQVFKSIWAFLNYWYFRYLMATELYMVEKWERMVFLCIAVVFLSILSLINCQLVSCISYFTMLLYPGASVTTSTLNIQQHSTLTIKLPA